eukprot:XP_010645785.1 PREDICTED: MAGE-like protein 2 [Vitis vinifera]
MARTRGAKSSSPSSRKKVPREEPVPGPISEPPRLKTVSPPLKPAPPKPPARRYLTRSGVPSPAPPAEPQEPQPPLPEPQNPSEIAPEAVIRRPMLTQPPIEGNLDCRAQPFHSELCFDIATFQLRPELAQLLCQILEHLGYPTEPQLERKRICREVFTLEKWNNMTTYRVDQPERPQPAARRAFPRHIPEGIPIAAPAIPRAPPRVMPFIGDPHSISEQPCS